MMGLLINLPRPKSDTVIVLEDLLAYDRQGQLNSLIAIAHFNNHAPQMGVSGRYLSHPEEALAVIRKLEHQLRWAQSLKGVT